MVKEERLRQIMVFVSKKRSASLDDLSKALNVSEGTIRRDISLLSDQGKLKAVRGGAIAYSTIPLQYRDREKSEIVEKKVIAEKALTFIKSGQVIFMDGGTSVLTLAQIIPPDTKITVVTNSFPTASALQDHPSVEVIFAGGRLCKRALVTKGLETVEIFRKFRADICFTAVASIHAEIGLTTVDYEEAQIKRTMIEMSDRIIALSTMERINTTESYFVASLSELDIIITDNNPKDECFKDYRKEGIEIV